MGITQQTLKAADVRLRVPRLGASHMVRLAGGSPKQKETEMIKGDWRALAHSIIKKECLAAYLAANTPRKSKHRPYHVPEIAAAIVRALNNDDEHEAKRLFLLWRTGALSLI